MLTKEIIQKMEKKGPRYTSYPPRPIWGKQDSKWWASKLSEATQASSGESFAGESFSMYVHVPFCAKQCLYCACNMTVNHDRDMHTRYVNALIKEVESVKANSGLKKLKQLHFGGGTPTYLKPEELDKILGAIKSNFTLEEGAEVSIEIDPRTAKAEHMQVLSSHGINRVSIGVQDFDEEVQRVVERHQSPKKVQEVVTWARESGIESINFDLIYGLPAQSLESMRNTLDVLLKERPGRIAFYSYAHVPWIKPKQKILEEYGLPNSQEKIDMLLQSREILFAAGYKEIGMDHFALPDDPLYLAYESGKLYRNFMGYTIQHSPVLIGVGNSAISETKNSFAQNESDWMKYAETIEADGFACTDGYEFNADDRVRKQVILDVMTQFKIDFSKFKTTHSKTFQEYFNSDWEKIVDLEEEGLIELSSLGINVTLMGRYFVRNIAMVFDAYLKPRAGKAPQYSSTI